MIASTCKDKGSMQIGHLAHEGAGIVSYHTTLQNIIIKIADYRKV